MADDVPVCDVLVEAMEYLVKLGSNLRTRSESLKDKRIRRDKLKNAHAVQKAANKVLMICELSKKSLDNVESGVKRVLQLVDKSQAAIGVGGNTDKGSPSDKSKTSDRQHSSEKKDYQYFRHRSTKLKINKKVPVKHYMSVKVLARLLPKSMQDKYPVYYDCKLYRMRKRKALKEQERKEILESMKTLKPDSVSDIMMEDSGKSKKCSKEHTDSEAEDGIKKSNPKCSGVTSEKSSEECNPEVQKQKNNPSLENKEKSDSDSDKNNKERKESSNKVKSNVETKYKQKEYKKSLLEDSESESETQSKEKSVKRKEETIGKSRSDDKGKEKDKRHVDKGDSASECKKSLLEDSESESKSQDKEERVKRKDKTSEKRRSDDKGKEKDKTHANKGDSASECKKSLLEDSESESESQNKEESVKRKDKTAEKRRSEEKGKEKSNSKELKKTASVRKDRKKSAIIESDSENETKKNSSEKSDNETFNVDDSSKIKKKKKFEKVSCKIKKRILSTDSETSLKESDKESRENNELSEENPNSDKEEQPNKSNKENQSKEKRSSSVRRSRSFEDTKSKNNGEKDLDQRENVIDLDSDDEKSEPVKEDKTEQQGDSKEEIKPLIKCVSLTKLLKPEILPIVISTSEKQKIHSDSKPSSKNRLRAKKTVRYQDEEELWLRKRAEVKAFKSKEFFIKITRLPLVDDIFMNTHNIKRITQDGKVVHEIKSENSKITSADCDDSQGKNKDRIEWPDISNVKTALLIDSDSDEDISKENNKESTPDKTKLKEKGSTDSKQKGSEKYDEFHSNQSGKGPNNIKSKEKESTDNEERGSKKSDELQSNQSEKGSDDFQSRESERSSDDLHSRESERSSDDLQSKESEKTSDDLQSKGSEKTSDDLLPKDLEKKSDHLQSSNDVEDASESSNNVQIESSQLDTENNLTEKGEDVDTGKSPEKEITPLQEDPEAVKSALLNDSSNSTPTPTSPKHKKKKLSESTTKSKRKHIMESMKAKKMLLTYSSSSDTEDENLKKAFKQIKEALLKEGSSEDEFSKIDKPTEDNKSSESESDCKKKRSREQMSSDSAEDILRKVKKKRKIRKTSRRSTSKSRTPSPTKKDAENGNSEAEGEGNLSIDSTINQVDGTVDEQSNSSNSKMGRSNEKAGSSQNSVTAEDKDIDGLTNLNSLNKTRRRRDSHSHSDAGGSGSSKLSKRNSKSKMPKATPLIRGEEGLLETVMTDDESGPESDAGVEEDLPPVALAGLNGAGGTIGAIGELAKGDLLGESDSSSSSSSSNEKDQHSEAEAEDNAKKEESSSEDQIKLKRRKIAISSDSDAPSSRRKRKEDADADARISDFEDSETEGSEPVKKSKKKKKVDSDEGSGGSSSESGKKKRKRIKQIDDSDASGSDSDNEGRNKHGRKNIRKVMGKNQLEEATKKAARQEKERLARIAERQKLYNNLQFDESGKPDEVVLDKVVLDFDPETKEPLIEVDRGLVKKLKPHQANGIKFMWDACFESVKRIKKDKGSGCILAHCMGLGKTLQVVSLTHTLLIHSELTRVERVLVVCPLSTVLNWVNEFKMWLKHAENDYEVDVYELSRYKQNSERAFQLSQWYNHGGVCVLGYEMFRNLSADNPKKYKKKMLKTFQEALVDPGPDMVVCDEGHLLKNEKTSLSQSMNRVRTLRRIVLTGTPLQNNLKEYYCMVQFVKPNLLGKYNEYLNRFVNPITNGQYTDSTEHDIRVMKRRSHVLHKMLDGAVQRRDYGVLAPFLPPKHEYVLFITLSEVQVKLYQHYLENYSRRPLPGKSSGFLFPDFQSLQRIWTHPLVLKYNSERYELMQQKKRDKEEEDSEGSLVDFIDDDSSPEETSTEESSDDLSDGSDDSRRKSKKKKDKKNKAKEAAASRRRGTRANPVELQEDEEIKDLDQIEGKNDNPTEWWIPLVTDDELEDVRNSHKLLLLLEILRQCEAIGDKLLVFSQSLYSLDLIEHFLGKIDEATQEARVDEKLGGHVGSWSPGVDYFRLDGSTSCENRSIWCKNFNREDNPRARLFLISTRAGGLGINLVAANRVVIFDVSWNPSHDVQSIFRVYRFGQKKPCYVYRFLAMGTMEEKIYERQVTKQAISKRVIDEQQIDRHYAENDLAELYKFEPAPPAPRPVPLVPRDRLFAEMLKQHENCIYKFHEHDSLLENKEEETLTEEERKAAWDDFENEKNRPPPAPFASAWPPHNGMAGLLAQQQQQLAFAALAAMLRKDMPGLTEEQIRAMLPLIYGSNPGLMQKLNDIYKYPQPSMMNPAMMNSVMNPAAAGGGSSGLQYEPPWAREQQQQQQMRLQQLMQHQNQMGAKYYAGGLGSRDPVAMALQQQRAREIMLGERAAGAGGAGGRPRGRPPLQPRAPPPGDVVTLDSD